MENLKQRVSSRGSDGHSTAIQTQKDFFSQLFPKTGLHYSKYDLINTQASASPGNLLERWNLRLHSELLHQNLHFSQSPRSSVCTPQFKNAED